MKQKFYKILATLGLIILSVSLIFRRSKKSIILDTKIDENKNKLDLVKEESKKIEIEKDEIKDTIKTTEAKIKETVAKKKSTESAIAKAKSFKKKYKKEK